MAGRRSRGRRARANSDAALESFTVVAGRSDPGLLHRGNRFPSCAAPAARGSGKLAHERTTSPSRKSNCGKSRARAPNESRRTPSRPAAPANSFSLEKTPAGSAACPDTHIRSGRSAGPISASMSNSSRNSRRTASAGDSPFSTLPAGKLPFAPVRLGPGVCGRSMSSVALDQRGGHGGHCALRSGQAGPGCASSTNWQPSHTAATARRAGKHCCFFGNSSSP